MWLSDAELAAVTGAAERAGMAPGAWLGEAGVRAAEAGTPEARVSGGLAALAPLYSELMEQRRVLRNVGGNLNDVARHVNSTGVVHPSTERVEQLVARVVERVDRAVEQVELLARETRAERARAGRASRLRLGRAVSRRGAGQAAATSHEVGQAVGRAVGPERGHGLESGRTMGHGHDAGPPDGPGREVSEP